MRRLLLAWGTGYVTGVVVANVYRRWRRRGFYPRARDRFMSPSDTWTVEDHRDYTRFCRRWDRVNSARETCRNLMSRATLGVYQPEDLD
ncbi:hypothetical protein CLV40_102172 [Actinokineospora auranticolor]|uniref:Uncharacterized protein n=1 Tax=Actinokineospora auranticolor TaxID=155976 RepID=A0A2S6GYM7_9PSEU|nr:hypothetical protein CLV40_102172 [Actinokineospora auranticolor]